MHCNNRIVETGEVGKASKRFKGCCSDGTQTPPCGATGEDGARVSAYSRNHVFERSAVQDERAILQA
jgi:hypothetical protein